MVKSNYTTCKLKKGEMNIYDFKKIKLYAYKTNDFLNDEVFMLEKAQKMVIIESPCFYDNIAELEEYVAKLDVDVEGILISYHASGAKFLKNVKKYATIKADAYGHSGGGKALIDNFEKTFGEVFDESIHTTTDILSAGKVNIGGIDFEIIENDEGYDIVIPEINAIYTHMLGHDCHSIVAGEQHANTIIDTLNNYVNMGYDLILTSHYTPEDLKDVKTKILYLQSIKDIAKDCKNGEEFKSKVTRLFPQYSGLNYLDMTTNYFFPSN